ncbi:MAG: hypothetical protein AWT59_1221 [Candidatus Gallionella acididurans]|uniref:Uncharacterized protein n=1 Tax=Candidatus Gallionella acididurans TaxID=1796491 RepID=A0A139BUI4_9PROT|nr:MAG: hypothetical protein AWT59_1221 [Candidatus Gallionella acididurans]
MAWKLSVKGYVDGLQRRFRAGKHYFMFDSHPPSISHEHDIKLFYYRRLHQANRALTYIEWINPLPYSLRHQQVGPDAGSARQ